MGLNSPSLLPSSSINSAGLHSGSQGYRVLHTKGEPGLGLSVGFCNRVSQLTAAVDVKQQLEPAQINALLHF